MKIWVISAGELCRGLSPHSAYVEKQDAKDKQKEIQKTGDDAHLVEVEIFGLEDGGDTMYGTPRR